MGLMYSHVVWGVRKMALLDLDLRQHGMGTDELLQNNHHAFYASIHVSQDDNEHVQEDMNEDTRLLLSLPSE